MGATRASMLLRRASGLGSPSPSQSQPARDSSGSSDVAGPRFVESLKPSPIEEVRLAGNPSVYDNGLVSACI